jgi:methionine synthase I (cobalamin-dependent)
MFSFMFAKMENHLSFYASYYANEIKRKLSGKTVNAFMNDVHECKTLTVAIIHFTYNTYG